MSKNILKEFTNRIKAIEENLATIGFKKKSKFINSDNIEIVDLDINLDIQNPQPDYSYTYAMNNIKNTDSSNTKDYLDIINETCSNDEIQKIAADIE